MLSFFLLFVWLLVVVLGVETCVVVIISNNAHCLPFPNFQRALSSVFELCFILFFCFCCFVMLNFILIVWHIFVVTCASMIIFYNVCCLFFHNFQGILSSFFWL
jgi:hypothetical protein